MANSHGTPIWYELITTDPVAATDFYTKVIGWTVGSFDGKTVAGDDDYRIVSAPDGQGIAGVMKQPQGGPNLGWVLYVGVDDVDASADALRQAGGTIHMGPLDLPGIGRLAMASDPQGAGFYLMRGASGESSQAFKRMAEGHGDWNELFTTDDAAALDFYGRLFGWTKDGAMPMGPGREYSFLSHDGSVIGAVMPTDTAAWQVYFRTGAIDDAAARVTEGGGKIANGPHQVPGGDWVVQARDPQGVSFGLVGSR